MRIAVISDIHANGDALTAVLADIDRQAPDALVCVGDSIGYGAEPERVLRTLRRRRIPATLGNHEQAVLEPERLEWFNHLARESLVKTAAMLSEDARRMIAGFPPFLIAHGCRFVHGFPPQSITTYHFEVSPEDRHRILVSIPEAVTFIGHTHDLTLISCDGRRTTESPLGPGRRPLAPNRRAIVCVGSVGQPRDGDPNAKYVIWDTAAAMLEVRFVRYDIGAAAAKIIAAGLPAVHANRLWCR
jgi:diadenosine tetraphosphatase ApaH/serine/threonine PP2A family protein phosphatase